MNLFELSLPLIVEVHHFLPPFVFTRFYQHFRLVILHLAVFSTATATCVFPSCYGRADKGHPCSQHLILLYSTYWPTKPFLTSSCRTKILIVLHISLPFTSSIANLQSLLFLSSLSPKNLGGSLALNTNHFFTIIVVEHHDILFSSQFKHSFFHVPSLYHEFTTPPLYQSLMSIRYF